MAFAQVVDLEYRAISRRSQEGGSFEKNYYVAFVKKAKHTSSKYNFLIVKSAFSIYKCIA